ncbi:ShlB/FhaC/HecB family hemolysin secretion/activation protein [Agrobacterium sp. NPDC090283]|uniref:ShlB/FhaC/HecB family hemolysin secretion/activation protein n=1 Tax=Agrobacterium sp. NPDC090283 TaxID=3363920 RepID=UPI00383BAB1C
MLLNRTIYISLAVLLLSFNISLAQSIPSTVAPGREAEQFRQPERPLSRPPTPTIQLEGATAPEGASAVSLVVTRINVEGSTVYSAQQLAAFTSGLTGKRISLQEVYDVASRLTGKYGGDGYVFSRAIIPPQALDPNGAVITLQVIEGYVDHVEWPEDLAGRYPSLFAAYTAKITAARPANIKTIERYLLLANDLPGLTVRSRFEASKANSGATTLKVELDRKPFAWSVQIDNRGTKGRGPWQYLTSVEANNALGLQERMGLVYAGSFDTEELQYVAGNVSVLLNAEGLTSFSSISYSKGDPGIYELRQLGYGGESFSFETGLSYPLLRSRDANLILSGSFFLEDSHGETDNLLISRDRIRGFRLKADYENADEYNGINQARLTLSQGISGLGATHADNPYASRDKGKPDFTSVSLYLSRLQGLGSGFSIFGAVKGSYSFNPLLAAEECSYGGRFAGRAFDPSELTGDRCFTALAELRYDLPELAPDISQAQLYQFVDFGSVHRIDPAAGEDRSADGSSAGIGFRTGWQNHLNMDVSAAKPLHGRSDKDWRFFLAVNTRF